MKTSLLIIIIVIVVVLVGGIYFLIQGSYKTPINNQNSAPNPPSVITPSTQSQEISISGFAFLPSSLIIKKGDTVTWTNQDSASHTIISDSGTEISSSSLSKTQTYSHTFDTVGTFNYHCSIHPSMKAKIIVE